MTRRILVAGVPRGGTTWVAQALGSSPGATYVHEPDNWAVDPLAFLGQRDVGRFPVLDAEARAPAYDLVWRLAMRGGWPADGRIAGMRERALRLPKRLAVPAIRAAASLAARRRPEHEVVVGKTVLGLGALEWLARRHADAVVIVRARPVNVVSSWRSLGWGPGHVDEDWLGRHRPEVLEAAGGWPADDLGNVVVAVAALTSMLDEAAARHPEWIVVAHEDLCTDSAARYRELFGKAGIEFGSATERFLARSDEPGEGLQTRRRTAEQPDRWRRLPPEDLMRAEELLVRLGLRD